MARITIPTIYKHITSLQPRRIALVTQKLREHVRREEGVDVTYRDLRNREEIFKSQLLQMGIQHVPFSEPELVAHKKEIGAKRAFDMCVITGEPFYQLFSIAAKIRKARYTGPLFLEVTEDEITKASNVRIAEANATRYEVVDLLRNLAYLTKTTPKGAPKEFEFQISIPIMGAPSQRVRSKRSRFQEVLLSPSDISEPPKKFKTHVSRIIRDTVRARALKELHEYRCQVCGTRIQVSDGTFYIEVHHVRPLGGDHSGLDTINNMLVLCPNHHAMFDFRIPRFLDCERIEMDGVCYPLTTKLNHRLSPEVVDYHNRLSQKPSS